MTKIRAKCGRCGKWYEYDEDTLELQEGRETWCLKCLGIENESESHQKVVILKRKKDGDLEPLEEDTFNEELEKADFENLETRQESYYKNLTSMEVNEFQNVVKAMRYNPRFLIENTTMLDWVNTSEYRIRLWLAQKNLYFGW
ncbi:MAG: hypothetical protein ACFFG0_04760 [Candidatus Thorarchaeota archaeon]